MGLEGLDVLVRAAFLHAVRILAALWMLPVFGAGNAGRLQKLGLALVLACATLSARGTAALEEARPGEDPVLLALLVMKELLFGVMLGWTAGLIFEAVRVAGALIATEMGLNLANQVDPVTRSSQPLLSHLLQSVAFVLFFVGGGHRTVLAALVRSFEEVPPGTFVLRQEMAESVLAFTGAMIAAGVRLAAPVFLLLVILTIAVGLLAKIAPNLHILEASYPVRILGALILLVLFLPGMLGTFDGLMEQMGIELFALARAGGR